MPHTMDVYPSSNAKDAEGGDVTTYGATPRNGDTPAPCLIRSDAAARRVFEQEGIVCSHAIATHYAGTRRGDKIIDGLSRTMHVLAINTQDGVGGIDSFVMIAAEQQL